MTISDDSDERDQVHFGPTVAPGVREIIRRRGSDGEFELGTLHDLKEGQPLPENSEVVRIQGPARDGWHDSETLYRTSGGPAQVATPAYREGYDRIFGKKEVGLA